MRLRLLIALTGVAAAAVLVLVDGPTHAATLGGTAQTKLDATSTAQPASAATTYVYATFKGDGAADQELWVYQSMDAINFGVLADTNYRGPTGVLRDPSIINYNGRYYIAHTVQSWTTNSTYFNIASSTDLSPGRTWPASTRELPTPGSSGPRSSSSRETRCGSL